MLAPHYCTASNPALSLGVTCYHLNVYSFLTFLYLNLLFIFHKRRCGSGRMMFVCLFSFLFTLLVWVFWPICNTERCIAPTQLDWESCLQTQFEFRCLLLRFQAVKTHAQESQFPSQRGLAQEPRDVRLALERVVRRQLVDGKHTEADRAQDRWTDFLMPHSDAQSNRWQLAVTSCKVTVNKMSLLKKKCI